MVTRDHMDLGSSVCSLGGVGSGASFHTQQESERRSFAPARSTTPTPRDVLLAEFPLRLQRRFSARSRRSQPLHPVLSDPDESDGIRAICPPIPMKGAVSAPPRGSDGTRDRYRPQQGDLHSCSTSLSPSSRRPPAGRPSRSRPSITSPTAIGIPASGARASSTSRRVRRWQGRRRRAGRSSAMSAIWRAGSPAPALRGSFGSPARPPRRSRAPPRHPRPSSPPDICRRRAASGPANSHAPITASG